MTPAGPAASRSRTNIINRSSIGSNNAVVTQLGECKTEDLEVAGSSPAHGTMTLLPSFLWVSP